MSGRGVWAALRAAVPAIGLLAACQPLPTPFLGDSRQANPLSIVRDGGGVRVEPPSGLPGDLGRRVAEAVAAGFREAEVPASVGAGNRASAQVGGAGGINPVVAGEVEMAVAWTVQAPDGGRIANFVQREPMPDPALSQGPTPRHLAEIGRRAAAAMIPLLTEAAPQSAIPETVAVWSIDGAPGDGAISLKRALEYVLRQNAIPVDDGRQDTSLLIVGAVSVGAPVAGMQDVSIRWQVLNADGAEIGTVSQSNTIKAGSLDGYWGDVAFAVAEAAFDGIGALLEKAPPIPTAATPGQGQKAAAKP